MKLLHIITSVDPRGGGPIEGILQRGLFLKDLGHQVEVLSLDSPSAPWVANFSLLVHPVGPSIGSYAWTPSIKVWLRAHARSYDHIIIHGLWQYHGIGVARTLWQMGLPYSVFTHGMLDPWFKETYPLKHLKKSLYWLLAEGSVLNRAARVFFTSEEERLRARNTFAPYLVQEYVVPYGTQTPPPANDEHIELLYTAHPELRDKHLFLFLSRIHEKKGCDLLIKAFAAVAPVHLQAHLIIAGPSTPSLLADLQGLATSLKLQERITWMGMLQGDAKWAALHAANAFVLPSHQENFGIAVVEALGCGTPVLLSDKVNIWREIAEDGVGIVAPDTVQGTLDNLTEWLSLSKQRQQHMGAEAKRSFAARYTAANMAYGLLSALAYPGLVKKARLN